MCIFMLICTCNSSGLLRMDMALLPPWSQRQKSLLSMKPNAMALMFSISHPMALQTLKVSCVSFQTRIVGGAFETLH